MVVGKQMDDFSMENQFHLDALNTKVFKILSRDSPKIPVSFGRASYECYPGQANILHLREQSL